MFLMFIYVLMSVKGGLKGLKGVYKSLLALDVFDVYLCFEGLEEGVQKESFERTHIGITGGGSAPPRPPFFFKAEHARGRIRNSLPPQILCATILLLLLLVLLPLLVGLLLILLFQAPPLLLLLLVLLLLQN